MNQQCVEDGQSVKFRAAYNIAEDGYDFLITQKMPFGEHYVKELVFYERPKNELIRPSFSLHYTEAQALFNVLWELGLRPKDGTGNSGHIEALKYHLEDMRKLVFK